MREVRIRKLTQMPADFADPPELHTYSIATSANYTHANPAGSKRLVRRDAHVRRRRLRIELSRWSPKRYLPREIGLRPDLPPRRVREHFRMTRTAQRLSGPGSAALLFLFCASVWILALSTRTHSRRTTISRSQARSASPLIYRSSIPGSRRRPAHRALAQVASPVRSPLTRPGN
jgi:hypothetical protein